MTFPLLDVLSPDLRAQVWARARRRRFKKGDIVFHQGDPGDVLHLVEAGRFAVEVLTPAGNVLVIRIISAGEHFGELALASGTDKRNATVVALERSSTVSIHRDDFEAIRLEAPAIDRLLVAALCARVRAETETSMDLAFMPADIRVYRRLVALFKVADVGPVSAPGVGEPLTIFINQEMLAGLAGTTRATANRAIRAIEKAGVVKLGRSSIAVLDLAALIRVAQM